MVVLTRAINVSRYGCLLCQPIWRDRRTASIEPDRRMAFHHRAEYVTLPAAIVVFTARIDNHSSWQNRNARCRSRCAILVEHLAAINGAGIVRHVIYRD